MSRLSRSILVLAALVSTPLPIVCGQSPFFWDEFDREELTDTEVPWSVFRSGEVQLTDGTLSFTPLADDFPGVGVSVSIADFTIRTRLRFHDPVNYQINPWIGLYGRNQPPTSYWAGPAADGSVYIGESDGRQDMIRSQKHLFSRDEILMQDIELELSAVGDTVTHLAWLAGTERPSEPSLRLKDDTLESGTFGIVLNPSSLLTGFDVRYFALLPGTPGDFNASRELDVEDIDLLAAEIRGGGTNRAFDLNEDAQVNHLDHEILISSQFNTWFGDANLDGEFNSGDLVDVLQLGEYEVGHDGNSTWASGDWDGNGDFDSADLVRAFQGGGYEQGPRLAVAAVPEPATGLGFSIGLLVLMRAPGVRLRVNRRPALMPGGLTPAARRS